MGWTHKGFFLPCNVLFDISERICFPVNGLAGIKAKYNFLLSFFKYDLIFDEVTIK